MKALYASIQDEMLKIEDSLEAAKKVTYPPLAAILKHVLKRGGKRLRPALTLLAGQAFAFSDDLHIPMATAVELLHTATLVHDDTIDDSSLRRGDATVNNLWGNNIAVLTGDYLFAKSAQLVSSTGNVRVMRLFAETLMRICGGELMQSFSAYEWQVSRDDYYQRIGSKTAALFSMATESGALLGGAPEPAVQALKAFGYDLGLAFQIVDDILDFTGDEDVVGKPVGSDLLHGTLTLPALLFLERYTKDSPASSTAPTRPASQDLGNMVQQIRDSFAIEDSYAAAKELCARARQALASLPSSPATHALASLTEYVLDREN